MQDMYNLERVQEMENSSVESCNYCGTTEAIQWLYCTCHKYNYGGHEDLCWCSEDCMEKDHPDNYDYNFVEDNEL